MKLVAISDTHTQHRRLTIPECDVLVVAGDFTYRGRWGEVIDFASWIKEQPAKHILVIAGNHELTFDTTRRGRDGYDPSIRDAIAKDPFGRITYLEDRGVTIDGINFYGTPWTPEFHGWAFNGLESSRLPMSNHPQLRDIYGRIDEDTHVLICHGPCYGCADQGGNGNDDERLGSMDLLKRTQQLKDLRLVIGGHIHEARGMVRHELGNKVYANVSTLDRDYQTIRPPVVFELGASGEVLKIEGYE